MLETQTNKHLFGSDEKRKKKIKKLVLASHDCFLFIICNLVLLSSNLVLEFFLGDKKFVR